MDHRRSHHSYVQVKQPKGAVPPHPPRPGGLCFRAASGATSGSSSIAPRKVMKKPSPSRRAPPQSTASSAGHWKSTFQPTDGCSPQDDASQDKSTIDAQNVDLYDPYDQLSSESESEMGQAKWCDRRSPKKDVDLRGHREIAHSQPEETRAEWRDRSAARRDRSSVRRDRSAARRDRSPGDRRPKHRSLSPSGSQHRPATSPGVPRTYDQLCYNPVRPNERSSPETHSLGEERVTGPPLNTEFATSVGLSTPNFPVDYRLQTGYCETGVSSVNMAPPREVAVSSRAIAVKDIEQQSAFSCELCEVEYARLEELQEHLESSSHWDTMEHIQKLNNYDDLTIAFLQEVMMFKVRQCCRAMVDQDLEALKETDHMTRVDMLHCAVCNVYISTSATSVKNHVSSMKHHHNKQSFCYRQKHQCLDKAAVMINLLKPQFEQYREGGNPFE